MTSCLTRKIVEELPSQGPVTIRYEKSTPDFWTLSDPTCSKDKILPQLNQHRIVVAAPGLTSALNPGYKEMDFRFLNTNAGGLDNRYIKGVFHNRHVVMHYRNCVLLGNSQYQCETFDDEVKNPGEPVNICSTKVYPRQSIENAALVALASIIKTAHLHEISTGGKWSRELSVYIMPKIENIIHLKDSDETLTFYNTDNARWLLRGGSVPEHSLEMLPHSKMYSGLPYPLQMAVISHETGHFIFYHHAPTLVEADYALQDVENHEVDPIYTSDLLDTSIPRKVTITQVKDSLNEGFADGIAWYSLSGDQNEIGTLRLGSTFAARNISTSSDDARKGKSLDEPTLRHFFQSTVSRRPNSITADHQDVHTIGAIVAFGFEASSVEPTSTRKGTLLMKWIQNVEKDYKEKKDDYKRKYQDLLMDAAWLMFKTHASHGLFNLTAKQCDAMKQVYPEYFLQHWKGKSNCT